MARTLSAIIFLVLSWYIESNGAAIFSVYHFPPQSSSTVTPRTTSTPNQPYAPPPYRPYPPPAYQPNPPPAYQPNPPPAYQPNPPPAYQPNPPPAYQPNPRSTTTAYSRTTRTTHRPNPQAAYQRNPSSSYRRNPPGRNPYGYGHYTVVEKCTNPSLPYRVYAYKNNTSVFWQVPKRPQVGDQITIGKRRKRRSIWVLEFVNVTSSDPKYLIRTNGSDPLYITYSSTGEVSLQQQVTEESYFIYEIGGGGYSYRVPGTNKSIGLMYNKLHIQNGQHLWQPKVPGQVMNCLGGVGDHVAIRHDVRPGIKWYYDNTVFHDDVLADTQIGTPLEARWISREYGWMNYQRDFRNKQPPNMYVTWSSDSNRLKFQTDIESKDTLNKRRLDVDPMNGSFKLFTSALNPPKYVHIESMNGDDDVLGLSGPSEAVSWRLTSLGNCCGLICKPLNLFRTCVSELVVETAIQIAPPRAP